MRPLLVRTARFVDALTATLTRNAEEKDLVIIGGGVAGYVAAIKAGQEGMKVRYAHIANSALAPALTHLALL